MGAISAEINKDFELIKNEFIKIKDKLLQMSKKENEEERLKTEEENRKKQNQSNNKNNDGAFIFNSNLKVTHIGLGNNMTIDQTEKGYLTPMRNMA
jgi:hypothetical protein